MVDAPKLPEVTETSAVDFGDWLHCVENVMGDLSANSAEWWKGVIEDAMDYYKKYQEADQFGRLALKPEPSVDAVDPKWSRVDRRGASILLASTPEVVAARARTTLEILARLMIVYRPGSATEKLMLLRKVESPEPATTVQEAIVALRQWSRFYQRAKDLGLAIPDPSILLRSLEGMVKRPVSEHNDIAFRMNLIRYHLRVDFAPSEMNILAIHRAYLAEFEQLGYKRGNKVKDEPSGQTQARIRAPVQGVPVEQLIEDAQKLMKAFMEQKSGATHPLRAKTAGDIPAGLGSVSVTLAGETRVTMDQNRAGTILGDEGTQPIVPLGTLVKALGYEFVWDKRGCRLRHPTKKEVKVYRKSTCPEASICASKTYKEREWTDNVRDYMLPGTLEDGLRVVMGAPFMNHVPMEDQLKVAVDIPTTEQDAWKWMKSFPLNRSRRRQLWQAQQWTVHLFSGNGVKNDPLRDLPGLLEIDSKKGWDLKNEKIYGVLFWAAKEGRIKHVFGGPPGAIYSPLRFRQNGESGPRAVRSMHEPWGLKEGLGVEDEARVRNENQALFKMIWLWLCAEAAIENQESGGDPKLCMPEGPHRDACVSVWSTEFMRRFVEEMGMVKFHFEQGALGHVMRRPTCCLSNLGLGINGLKDSRCWTSKEDGQDVDQTIWPHGFRITLADAIHEWNNALNRVVVKKAMSKTEMVEWKAHVE
ncbi:unnamed protein product [Symbiodinium sp. CCMP2456]|nr:unnamed protein product [Symbiodinium sp. CCMP2456]